MKLTKLPTTRTNVSIELNPDEQDLLFTLFGNLIGDGPIRNLTTDLWYALQASEAKEIPHKNTRSLKLMWY